MRSLIHRVPPAAGWLLLLASLFAGAGCSSKVRDEFVSDQPPTLRLTHAPISSNSRESYLYKMNWVAYDPDGRVDYFLWAKDPKDLDKPDSTWVRTTKNEEVIDFTARDPDLPIDDEKLINWPASEPHIFAIRAVDNLGMQSETVYRAFFATTAAPYIRVDSPSPNKNFEPLVTPSVRIKWSGDDPDGPINRPTRYLFRMFGRTNSDFPAIPDFIQFVEQFPDSFRKLYAPAFPGWTQVPGDVAEFQYNGLVPNSTYLFAITGFDTAGAYDPVFSRSKNLLKMNVSFAGNNGPIITMYNQFFNFTYPSGGYLNDPSRYFRVEVPAGLPVTFNWLATFSTQGAELKQSRWVLDLQDLTDETPRESQNDWYHWSSYSATSLSATIGPFNPPQGKTETHLFYIEVEDNNGLKSLGIIQFQVVRPTFIRPLLFVQDMRPSGDGANSSGVYQPPSGVWPNKAELDTFFYARGGFPWKGAYQSLPDPAQRTSQPGIFLGYDFDTISVRQFPDGIIPLSLLGRYTHVVWYCDNQTASQFRNPTTNSALGAPALFKISSRGNPNTLATYLTQGGSVWLFGGGAARATLQDYVKISGSADVFNARDLELLPGRFMYDFAHWQSEITVNRPAQEEALMWNMFDSPGAPATPNAASPSRGWAGAPDYSKLSTLLLSNGMPGLARKTSTIDDPVPPFRTTSSYFLTQFQGEALTVGNFIIEDLNGADTPGGLASTLDTLYFASGGFFQGRPQMTYYHGLDAPAHDSNLSKFVFSGFPLWYFRRAHQITLADFVLQDIWGLQREPLPRGPLYGARAAAPTAMRITAPTASRVAASPSRPLRTPGVNR